MCFWLRVIIESLKKYPHYGRSLFGLQAVGKHEVAQVVKAELETAWKVMIRRHSQNVIKKFQIIVCVTAAIGEVQPLASYATCSPTFGRSSFKLGEDRSCFHSGLSKKVQADIAFICCLTLPFILKFGSNASWLMQSNVQFGY